MLTYTQRTRFKGALKARFHIVRSVSPPRTLTAKKAGSKLPRAACNPSLVA